MILSRQQQAIIRNIAKLQIESYLRIDDPQQLKELLEEMDEEGYDVTELDLRNRLAIWVEIWDSVIEDPNKFLNRLDEVNLSMLRHHLFQEFQIDPETRGIWRKLNLFEKITNN